MLLQRNFCSVLLGWQLRDITSSRAHPDVGRTPSPVLSPQPISSSLLPCFQRKCLSDSEEEEEGVMREERRQRRGERAEWLSQEEKEQRR